MNAISPLPPWSDILDPQSPWTECYPTVAAVVRPYLATLPPGKTLSADELVKRLWPDAVIRGEDITRRVRLWRALDALAKHGLSDCVTIEQDTTTYWARARGKPVNRKRWHAPDPSRTPQAASDGLTPIHDATPALATPTLADRVAILESQIQQIKDFLVI